VTAVLIQRDDAAAYALGAVSAPEREAFERLLQRDPALVLEVDTWREVVAMLAYTAPPVSPPSGLRDKIVR
jgi:anti-sigma-K factor RskA